MGQIRKARGISRRKQAVSLQRYMKVAVAYLLLITVIFSNMSNPLMNVFAGQKKEEFRIHADELQRAAEEALEEENVVEEPLEIYTKDASLQKEYDELLAADGTLYEVFPEYERENDLDEIDLRIFLRLSEDADPKSYALTGEETFIFLYVNGGDETVAGRVNIDGYISGVCSLKSYAAVFDKDGKDIVIHSDTEDSTQKEDETQQAQEEKETSEQKENTSEQTGEKKSHDTAEKDTADQSDKNDTVNEDKSQDSSADTDASDAADSVQEDTADAKDSSSDTDTSEQGSDTEDVADTDSADNSDTEDSASSEQEADDSDVVASISSHPRFLLTEVAGDDSSVELEETKEEIKAVEKEEEITVTKPAKETEAPVTEAETTVEETTAEETSAVETSAEETLPAEAEETTAAAEETKASTEETTTEAQISDLPDDTNTAEEEDEPDFKRVGTLKGETYNLASLDQTVTIRAFTAKLSDMGLDKEELENQGHMIDYMIDPTGSAELVKASKLARDGAEVTFGVIPQTGYKITEITANGTELEEVEAANIASPSNAERADNAVYYVIPEVLEDQEVEIFLEEEVPGSHPAFDQSKTVNGVIVSVTAEEGIIPEGTVLEVTEVTDQVKDAVIKKAASDESDVSNVTDVIAYDINLMLDGKKLNNDWGKNHHVNVKFSGERVEQLSKNADTLQVATLETPTETVEAALGGTEEMPVVDNITADNIQINAEGRDSIDVAGEASLKEVEFEAKHFTIYTITFGNNQSSGVRIIQLDEDGKVISKNDGTIAITGTNVGAESLLSGYTPTGYEYSWSMLGGKYDDEDSISHETLNNMILLETLSRGRQGNSYYLSYTGKNRNLKAVSGTVNSSTQDVYIIYRNKNTANEGIKLYYLSPANDGYELPYMNGVKFVVDCINTEGKKVNLPAGSYIPDVLTFDSELKITSSTFSDISIPGFTFTNNGYCFFWWGGNEDNFFSSSAKATVTGLKNWGRVSDNYPSYNYIGYNSNEYKWTDWTGEAGNYVAYNPTGSLHVVFVEVSQENPPKTYYASMNQDIENPLNDRVGEWDKDNLNYKFYPINKTREYTETYLRNGGFAPAEESGYEWKFEGWTTTFDTLTGNGTGNVISESFFDAPVIQDVHLYAKWIKTQKTVDIEITKKLEGVSGSSNELTKVKFALYNSTSDWSNGSLIQTVDATSEGLVKFEKIPVGYYLVYETKTAEGYILLTEPIKVVVSQKADKTLEWKVEGADSANSYEVLNRKGAILPDTGGQGLDSIHRLGWSVILASVMFAGFQLSQTIKRKREK